MTATIGNHARELISSCTLSKPMEAELKKSAMRNVVFTRDLGLDARNEAIRHLVERGAAYMRRGIPRVGMEQRRAFMDFKYGLLSGAEIERILDAKMESGVARLRSFLDTSGSLKPSNGQVHIHGTAAASLGMGMLLIRSFLVPLGDPVHLYGVSTVDVETITGGSPPGKVRELFRFVPRGYDYRKIHRENDPSIFAVICTPVGPDLIGAAINARVFMRNSLCFVAIPTKYNLDNDIPDSDSKCSKFVREVTGRYPFLCNTGVYLNIPSRAPRGAIRSSSLVIFAIKKQ